MGEDTRFEYAGFEADNKRLEALQQELVTVVKERLTDEQIYQAMHISLIRMALCSVKISFHQKKEPVVAADLASHACTALCLFSHVVPDEQIHEWTKEAMQLAFRQVYHIQAVYAPKEETTDTNLQA